MSIRELPNPRAGIPGGTAAALRKLREVALGHSPRGDWAAVQDLSAILHASVVLGDRRTVRQQEARDEIRDIVSVAFPTSQGLTAVAEFQAGFFQRRPLGVPRRWPLVGSRVRLSSVWVPDNSQDCVWTRGNPGPLTARQLRRVDRLIRRLERAGVFDTRLDIAQVIDGSTWMDPEPEAYPGLDRLVLTIAAPPRIEDTARPAPPDPLAVLHSIADAIQYATADDDAVAEVVFHFDWIGWSLPPRGTEPVREGSPPHPSASRADTRSGAPHQQEGQDADPGQPWPGGYSEEPPF